MQDPEMDASDQTSFDRAMSMPAQRPADRWGFSDILGDASLRTSSGVALHTHVKSARNSAAGAVPKKQLAGEEHLVQSAHADGGGDVRERKVPPF
jgi:hypothetical protein